MVETKNGESYDGVLEGCDGYMNLKLSSAIVTSIDGKFSKFDTVFIRGNNIKSIQMAEDTIPKH